MDNLEGIVNKESKKKRILGRIKNIARGALLAGSLLLGVYLSGCGDKVSAVGWIGGGQNTWQTKKGASSGSNYQSFNSPASVFVDNEGNVYIADVGNYRISRWDSDGNATGWIGGGSGGWKTKSETPWGLDFNSFNSPKSVFVNNKNVYIADLGNNRISKWDKNGNAIGWIGEGTNNWKTTRNEQRQGKDNQSFHQPYCGFVDNEKNIYVADMLNNRISKWSSSGKAIGWIGGGSNGWKTGNGAVSGSDYQSFKSIYGVFLDNSGKIYVADTHNHRICKWDSFGNAIGWIGGGSDGWKTSEGASKGKDYQSFNSPHGVFVDNSGKIYVADTSNHRISKWSNSGKALGWIGGENKWKKSSGASKGKDYQSFNSPASVFVDDNGNIYVADEENNRICKWED